MFKPGAGSFWTWTAGAAVVVTTVNPTHQQLRRFRAARGVGRLCLIVFVSIFL
jgi:hypothetical protein